MLFTWSTKNLCIVFPQWRVTGPFSLFVSLVVIVLLTAGYEGVRRVTRKYEAGHVQRLGGITSTGEFLPFLWSYIGGIPLEGLDDGMALFAPGSNTVFLKCIQKAMRSPTNVPVPQLRLAWMTRTKAHRCL